MLYFTYDLVYSLSSKESVMPMIITEQHVM